MKFFQKRWVAITLCVLMSVAAWAIGQAKNRSAVYAPASSNAAEAWGEENYGSYARYIQDDVGLLSEKTIREISEWNATFDYSYDSICGVGIVLGVEGQSMEDAAFDLGDALGLGENDFFLLLDAENEDWYFVYGEEASYYVDKELEVLAIGAMNEMFQTPDAAMQEFFVGLANWYNNKMPVAGKVVRGSSFGMVAGGTILFILLIVVLVIAAVFSALFRAGRRVVGRGGGWMPLIFLGGRRHRTNYGPGPGPRPNPGPNHRTGPSSSAGGPRNGGAAPKRSSGGFGSGSRGNFNHGGGFGGSNRSGGSRGGGFGGRR